MRRKLGILAVITTIVLALCAACCAQEFRIPLMSHAPTIDGKIDPQEWAVAAGFDGFGYDDILNQRRTQSFVGADENTLYFAIRSQLPTEGSLISLDRDQLTGMYYSDDTVGVQINPDPTQSAQAVYQLMVNHLGRYRFRVHVKNNALEDPGWDGRWRYASSFTNGYWEFECAVPVASMGMVKKGRKTTDGVWHIDLNRDWKGPGSLPSSLSAMGAHFGFSGGGIHYMTGIDFRFVKSAAPAVQYSVSTDPFLSDFRGVLALYNPAAVPLDLDASIMIDRDRMPEIHTQKKITLAPGQREALPVVCPKDDATTQFIQHTTVKSADGKIVYYDRTTKWPRSQALQYKGGTVQVKLDPVKVDYAYYPYENTMRVALDITGMPKTAGMSKITATVREADGGKVIKSIAFDPTEFKSNRAEHKFGLPELKGQYELVVHTEGANPPADVVKPFERTVYEWEHNTLGMSTKVYAPFTPITLDGSKLSTVLRVHTLNNVGLLDQITGKSAQTGITKPILAAPMRYVAVVGGQPAPITAGQLKVTSTQPNEVKTRAEFSAGALKAVSNNTWDYDGTLRVDLTLLPSSGREINEFTLEIPLDAKTATMIHANADRIRAPVAQKLPEGKGVIWTGSKVSTNDWPKTFCPYIFLGDAVRGLSWFADNDKGWSWDTSTPNLDVVRSGKQVILRVHLINKPVVIAKPTTVTFGLLAAPVKPMLNVSSNPNWWRYRYTRDNYSLLGTDINWLALGNCAAVYPAGKDMYLWEMIARGNVEHLSDEDVKSVIDRGRKYFEPYGDYVKAFEAHVNYNLRSRYGTKMVFYYNRASYQDCDEFQTFKDEWGCTDMRSVEKGIALDEIKVVPTRSYNDYAMYWYNKSFDIGRNRGVYWDNLFIIPTLNTEMTDAYTREDGTVVPSAGVWAMRDLVKRTFILENERGMTPITFPHMTSFNCLPLMSFSTVQYDWEWKYSEGEVQDRFTREYILLATSGELAGVWPVPLADMGSQAADPWIQRTFLAVRLVHELDNGSVPQAIMDILDEPGLQVYRYWDDRPQPVATDNPDVPTVVYCVPGVRTVAAVVSYSGENQDIRVKIDPKALGLRGGFTITNAETKEPLQAKGNTLAISLKKHDMMIIEIKAKDKPK